MEKCDECVDHVCCDFCGYFSFDERWCYKHNKEKTPIDDCEDFKCFRIWKEEG